MLTDEIPPPQQSGKTRKSQAAAATRDRLLQAAIDVIQNQGIERCIIPVLSIGLNK
jgi:hypothetical protein